MKFEEQFPSLKDIKGKMPTCNCSQVYCKCEVKQHCLDKAKVKEVITAYLCKYTCKKSRKIRLLREGILEELELK